MLIDLKSKERSKSLSSLLLSSDSIKGLISFLGRDFFGDGGGITNACFSFSTVLKSCNAEWRFFELPFVLFNCKPFEFL